MKYLNKDDASYRLKTIGMGLDHWNRIVDPGRSRGRNDFFTHYQAPRDATNLYCFSQHIAGWLPVGHWKIFQVDDATTLAPDEAFLLDCLLRGGPDNTSEFMTNRTFLFEFGNGKTADAKTELIIANLIHVFLLFECHGYVVSSGSSSGEILGIQDGFAYFLSRDKRLAGAQELLDRFENNPRKIPDWVIRFQPERCDE
jgi:hypothetical protein